MSKSAEKASGKALDEPQNDSVYDFLYCDSRRIGSFLAQFDDSGHLERVVQRESTGKAVKRAFKINVGAGASILGTGGQGTLGLERGPVDEGSESSERVYDPLWTNARTFLDYLIGAELLRREVAKARIGQFVLLSGALSIFDMALLRSAWNQPFIQNLMKASMGALATPSPPLPNVSRQQKRATERNQPSNVEQASPADAVLGMLQFLPHNIISSVRCESVNVWCNLKSENLVVSSSDIVLKHGISIPGEWSVVGILDALPDEVDAQGLAEISTAGFELGSLGAAAAGFGPAIRGMLGRPRESYGVTPLIIFRKITG